jgi:hypothetical protein
MEKALLPAAVRQTTVIRRVAAMAPWAAPVTGRARIAGNRTLLVVTIRQTTVEWRGPATTVGTTPCIGAAAAGHQRDVRWRVDRRHERRGGGKRRCCEESSSGDNECDFRVHVDSRYVLDALSGLHTLDLPLIGLHIEGGRSLPRTARETAWGHLSVGPTVALEGRSRTGNLFRPTAARRCSPTTGGLADIDPTPHHHFWVCAQRRVEIISLASADGRRNNLASSRNHWRTEMVHSISKCDMPVISMASLRRF